MKPYTKPKSIVRVFKFTQRYSWGVVLLECGFFVIGYSVADVWR